MQRLLPPTQSATHKPRRRQEHERELRGARARRRVIDELLQAIGSDVRLCVAHARQRTFGLNSGVLGVLVGAAAEAAAAPSSSSNEMKSELRMWSLTSSLASSTSTCAVERQQSTSCPR